ncbi:hypothetical protein B0H16DRAFT_1699336 [Mycena metata]|uniref:Uncharacterized protein n=1 Tax=Mycena metata TaxID=1033252 RepID=A0AAD7HJT2_9AGAR|nr:hypothetical protein B0H16DRAFT_1699336 [Mycena metata]
MEVKSEVEMMRSGVFVLDLAVHYVPNDTPIGCLADRRWAGGKTDTGWDVYGSHTLLLQQFRGASLAPRVFLHQLGVLDATHSPSAPLNRSCAERLPVERRTHAQRTFTPLTAYTSIPSSRHVSAFAVMTDIHRLPPPMPGRPRPRHDIKCSTSELVAAAAFDLPPSLPLPHTSRSTRLVLAHSPPSR